MSTLKRKKIKATNFDKAFEQKDVTEYLDLKSAKTKLVTPTMPARLKRTPKTRGGQDDGYQQSRQ